MTARIVIDEREKNSKVPDLLRQSGALIEFAQLTVGDYIISSETAIERKTVRDLVHSIFDGRLFIQCADLRKFFEKPLIIVEGNIMEIFEHDETQHDYQLDIARADNVYDSLGRVALEYKIPIIHTPAPEFTSLLLVSLVNNISGNRGANKGPLLRKIKKTNSMEVQQLSILTSIPGVGETLASRMLRRFQSPRRAINASSAELARIPGFGTARAERVRKILDSIQYQTTERQTTLKDQFSE